MDQRAERRISRDCDGEDQHPDDRSGVKIGGGDADHEAHEGAHRKIEVVDGHDQHLCDGCQCDRDGKIEQEVQPGVAHGTRLHVEDGGQKQDKREHRRQQADSGRGEAHYS